MYNKLQPINRSLKLILKFLFYTVLSRYTIPNLHDDEDDDNLLSTCENSWANIIKPNSSYIAPKQNDSKTKNFS